MIVNVYLLGSMITMVAALIVGHSGRLSVTLLAAVVGAVLWPVLVLGGIQLLAVGLLADQQKRPHSHAVVGSPLHRLIPR